MTKNKKKLPKQTSASTKPPPPTPNKKSTLVFRTIKWFFGSVSALIILKFIYNFFYPELPSMFIRTIVFGMSRYMTKAEYDTTNFGYPACAPYNSSNGTYTIDWRLVPADSNRKEFELRYDTYILTKEDIVKFLMAKRYPLKAGIAMSKFYGMHIVIQNRGKVMAHDQTGIVYIRLSNQKKWHQINSTAQATDISADTTELAPFPLRIDASECFPESIYVQVVSTCYSDERFSKRTKVIDTMRAIYLTNSGDIQTSINPSDWVMDKIAPMTRILSTKPD